MTQDQPTEATPAADSPPPAPAPDRDSLSLAGLAQAILAREFRPRVREIRRLADAVLATEEKRARKKAGGGKKGGKKHKLAKIPGQKAKK
ncbi:MAG TPA: hypothetical protein VNR60_05155 [Croceibacterium sp.]|nr:hypothetical protein [Croceibacterium sp.]